MRRELLTLGNTPRSSPGAHRWNDLSAMHACHIMADGIISRMMSARPVSRVHACVCALRTAMPLGEIEDDLVGELSHGWFTLFISVLF